MTSTLHWMAATRLEGIGPLQLKKWVELMGDIKSLFSTPAIELKKLGFLDKHIDAIQKTNWTFLEKELNWYEKNHCTVVSWEDENYPSLLHHVSGAPLVLYVKGPIKLLTQPQLALVGSRNPSIIGLETAEHFAYSLSQAGLTITSGLALGIDAASHKGALAAQGKTIAVLGTGLKNLYPRTNLTLAEKIIEQGGAFVSEFPADALPKAHHFPLRNRVISGLSLGVLVIEAALKSGSLITARYAVEQGREVFAIPGSIHHPLSKGCHELLKQGAKLVESIKDILLELGSFYNSGLIIEPDPRNSPILNKSEQTLLKKIGFEPTPLDIIIKRTGLTLEKVSAMLLSLELNGMISCGIGGYIRHR